MNQNINFEDVKNYFLKEDPFYLFQSIYPTVEANHLKKVIHKILEDLENAIKLLP